jgi:hypothetical protein
MLAIGLAEAMSQFDALTGWPVWTRSSGMVRDGGGWAAAC